MVKAYQVKNLNKVNTTLYKEGDIFYTKKTAAMLINGKIRPLFANKPSLENYVRKDEVQKMIDEAIEKVVKQNNG